MSVLRMLLPGTAEVGDLDSARDATVQALADLYAYPDPMPAAGWVRANMVASLDGSATGPDERSGSLGGPADKAVFGVLRGLADVVLVGASTVRAEGYRPLQARPEFADRRASQLQPSAPALAIVTRGADLPRDTGLFDAKGTGEVLLITTASADLDAMKAVVGPDRVLVSGDDELDLTAAVSHLARRGLGRVLLEGGPRLLGTALAAGRVDEVCLTWSPLLVAGSGPRIATGPDAALLARPAHLIAAGDLLLGRWLVQRPA